MGHPLALYLRRRVGVQLPLGYASGLPYLLVGETLGTWMATEGVNLKTIGAFALCGLAYNLKIIWAPLIDRYPLPLLGRRRGWLLLFQLLLGVGIAAMGSAHPAADPQGTAILAALVAFLAASQDIVTDAYRADVLPEEDRAAGIAVFTLGYRLGMLAAGAIALVLVKSLGWPTIYRGLGLSMAIGVVGTLLAPNPEQVVSRPKTVFASYVRPIADLVTRQRAAVIISFILLYRFAYLMALPMNSPFLIHLGFTTADLGYWRKGVGLVATLLGGLVAGPAVARLGAFRALTIFGITQALIHLSWVALVYTGPQAWMLAITIGVENFFIGLAVTSFETYLMSQTNSSFSATQLAALNSLSSLGGRLFGASSGVAAAALGWPLFFGGTSLLALPALVLVLFLPRGSKTQETPRAGAADGERTAGTAGKEPVAGTAGEESAKTTGT